MSCLSIFSFLSFLILSDHMFTKAYCGVVAADVPLPISDLLMVVGSAWNPLLVGKSSASHLREAVFYSSLAAGSCSPGSEPFP